MCQTWPSLWSVSCRGCRRRRLRQRQHHQPQQCHNHQHYRHHHQQHHHDHRHHVYPRDQHHHYSYHHNHHRHYHHQHRQQQPQHHAMTTICIIVRTCARSGMLGAKSPKTLQDSAEEHEAPMSRRRLRPIFGDLGPLGLGARWGVQNALGLGFRV